jgi:hypothetical protein
MDNGIKQYQAGNYGPAIAEFQAAYEVKQKASPLINIALCYKARANYPKAIEALTTALEKHSDSMDADDKQAAASEIKAMRALLAYVDVTLSPPQATLVIDDEEQRAGSASKPVPLGPGTHKIAARAEGFSPAEQSVTVASGDKTEIKLALVPDKGWVTLQAPDPRMTIAVDQRVMGTGQWAGMLPPGTHLVQMYGSGGPPFTAQILVIAGKQLNVRPGESGMPVPGLPVPPLPLPPTKKDPPPLPARRGPYGFVLGAILFPMAHPHLFEDPKRDYGAGYGLRGGYQVNRIAGFDVMYDHSSITTTSAIDEVSGIESRYQAIANRLAIGLRLLSSGRSVRFVGAIGGGPVFDKFDFSLTEQAIAKCSAEKSGQRCPLDPEGGSTSAVDAFMYMEGGLEVDLDHVLIDLGLTIDFQATGGIGNKGDIFDGHALWHVGPALRVGYRFW